MTKTTELIKREDMPHRDMANCHDGAGTLDFTAVYGRREDRPATAVRFIHDDVLPPGVSIGYHQHHHEEEYYYVISGAGLMQLDGREFAVSAGDVAIVYPGGAHGLVNNTDQPLRIIVVGAAVTPD
jgi:mannose-6-phosphate isomerase-like protein (cupin superfamily)